VHSTQNYDALLSIFNPKIDIVQDIATVTFYSNIIYIVYSISYQEFGMKVYI